MAPRRIGIRAQNRRPPANLRVENGVVERRITDIADRIGTFGEDDRLRGKCPVTGDPRIHQLFCLGQRIGGDHGGEERVAGALAGLGLREDRSLAA